MKLTQQVLKNSLLLSGEIDDAALLPLTQYLAKYKKGTILINSEGGNVVAGLAMYDIIRASGCDLTAIVVGECQSIAIMPLLACKKRYGLKHSKFSIHHGSFEMNQPESQKEMVGIVKELIEQDKDYQNIILSTTKMTAKELANKIKYGYYFNSTEATKYKFIEKIL